MMPFSNMVAGAGIILWLLITGAYVAAFDPLVALFFSILAVLVVWSCAVKTMTHKTE
jgi:hypothetical protein